MSNMNRPSRLARRLLILVVGLAAAGPTAVADLRADETYGALPKPPLLEDALRARWMTFRIAWGRIETVTPREGSIGYQTGDRGADESLTLSCDAVGGVLDYTRSGPGGEFTLSVRRENCIDMRWVPTGDSTVREVRFTQGLSQEDPLVLAIGSGNDAVRHTAPTLWHLWLSHPEAAKRHLVPLLALIMPRRELETRVADVEAALLRAAAEGKVPSQSEWQAHLEELTDDDFVRREEADAALRAAGPTVLWYLKRCRLDQDAEQRFRAFRIQKSLATHPVDATPGSTAAWLAGDPEIWSALARRSDARTKRLADSALDKLTGDSSSQR